MPRITELVIRNNTGMQNHFVISVFALRAADHPFLVHVDRENGHLIVETAPDVKFTNGQILTDEDIPRTRLSWKWARVLRTKTPGRGVLRTTDLIVIDTLRCSGDVTVTIDLMPDCPWSVNSLNATQRANELRVLSRCMNIYTQNNAEVCFSPASIKFFTLVERFARHTEQQHQEQDPKQQQEQQGPIAEEEDE